jgi:hypothetical protein
VFINMAFMREMQVSVVQVIDVAVVLYGDMSAVGTMLVSVLLVDGVRLCRQKCTPSVLDQFLERGLLLEWASGIVASEST